MCAVFLRAEMIETPSGYAHYTGHVNHTHQPHGIGRLLYCGAQRSGELVVGLFSHGLVDGVNLTTYPNGDRRLCWSYKGVRKGSAVYVKCANHTCHVELWVDGCKTLLSRAARHDAEAIARCLDAFHRSMREAGFIVLASMSFQLPDHVYHGFKADEEAIHTLHHHHVQLAPARTALDRIPEDTTSSTDDNPAPCPMGSTLQPAPANDVLSAQLHTILRRSGESFLMDSSIY